MVGTLEVVEEEWGPDPLLLSVKSSSEKGEFSRVVSNVPLQKIHGTGSSVGGRQGETGP